MKKILLISLLLLFSITTLFSENSFEIGVFSGIKNAEVSKSIYLNNTQTKVSELEWNQDIIPVLGVNLSYQLYNFGIESFFSAGIPMTAGSMYDSDWNLNGIQKNYTISECDTVRDFCAGLTLKYEFNADEIVSFSPIVQVVYSFNDFVAHDGYGWYGGYENSKYPRDYDVAWNDPEARKAKKIRNIDYYRHSFFIFSGIQMQLNLTEKIGIESAFQFSPFCYMYSVDTHHRSEINTHYVDIQQSNFTKYKIDFMPFYSLNSHFSIYTNFSAIFGTEDYGDLYHDELSDKPTKSNTQPTGSNYKSLNLSLGCNFKF